MHLDEIREQVGRGCYRVDAGAVADAIVRRLLSTPSALRPPTGRPQGECS